MLPQRELLSFSLQKSHSLLKELASEDALDTPEFVVGDLKTEFDIASRQNSDLQVDASLLHGVGPRRGQIRFGEVVVETPCFMPVGTAGSVKALTADDVRSCGFNLILGNTYHLNLRPGMDVMREFGGLHNFMNWPGVILTDSGGFQVMSLAKIRKLTEEGVTFNSHIDGSKINLTPEKAVEIQETIDADIHMVLDECTPYPASIDEARHSMERSMRWARRCREARKKMNRAQFGIVQGGMYASLRMRSALALRDIGFEGYAVGGLSVGESKREMRRALAATLPYMPADKPRYLMGVGTPDDIVDAVLMGIDMFDCVLPTRNARNGSLFVRRSAWPNGKLQIKNAAHRFSTLPLDPSCTCYTCKNFSRSYLRHLFVAKELVVYRLLTLHNIKFLEDLTAALRASIADGSILEKVASIRETFVPSKD